MLSFVKCSVFACFVIASSHSLSMSIISMYHVHCLLGNLFSYFFYVLSIKRLCIQQINITQRLILLLSLYALLACISVFLWKGNVVSYRISSRRNAYNLLIISLIQF